MYFNLLPAVSKLLPSARFNCNCANRPVFAQRAAKILRRAPIITIVQNKLKLLVRVAQRPSCKAVVPSLSLNANFSVPPHE